MYDASGFSDWFGAYYNGYAKPVAKGITNYFKSGFQDMGKMLSGGSYSDFTRDRNEATDGWYSTLMDAFPLVGNIHRAILGRDSAKDYMDQNGLSWSDMLGYNTSKITANISNNLGGAIATGSKYLNNMSNDLGKLYAKE